MGVSERERRQEKKVTKSRIVRDCARSVLFGEFESWATGF